MRKFRRIYYCPTCKSELHFDKGRVPFVIQTLEDGTEQLLIPEGFATGGADRYVCLSCRTVYRDTGKVLILMSGGQLRGEGT